MKTNYKIKGIKRLFVIAILSLLGINTINAQCNANFTYTVGAAGNVNFTSTSTGTNVNTYYEWYFGDGATQQAFNPLANHTYSSNGTFSATLLIKDTLMTCLDTITKSFLINNAPCTGSASFSAFAGAGGLMNFYDTSTGIAPNSTYQWFFGDGTNANTGIVPNAAHTYTAGGVYNVNMIIADPLAICIYSMTQNFTVSIVSCSLSANFTYTTGANGSANFTSTSTGTTLTTNYFWDFGDGFYGSGAVTSHSYTSNGLYNVQLNVFDSLMFSCSDTITKPVNITNAPCIANANFVIAKDSTMAFTWDAFPVYPMNIASATWSWGDGSSTVALYPSHTYSAAGLYNICLTVSLTCGATSSMCINSNVYKTTQNNSIIYLNVINQLAAGINSLSKEEKGTVNLYPNPNNGEFKFSMNGIRSNSNEIEINVYNLLGEVVYTTKHELINGSLSANMHMNEIPNGAYFIKAVTAGKTYTVKAIINR